MPFSPSMGLKGFGERFSNSQPETFLEIRGLLLLAIRQADPGLPRLRLFLLSLSEKCKSKMVKIIW